jgi:hypothetical protein
VTFSSISNVATTFPLADWIGFVWCSSTEAEIQAILLEHKVAAIDPAKEKKQVCQSVLPSGLCCAFPNCASTFDLSAVS